LAGVVGFRCRVTGDPAFVAGRGAIRLLELLCAAVAIHGMTSTFVRVPRAQHHVAVARNLTRPAPGRSDRARSAPASPAPSS
jgi:hypothetical protein